MVPAGALTIDGQVEASHPRGMPGAFEMRATATVAGLLLAGGCAVATPRPPPSAAEVRGHDLAREVCARCHAVEAVGESPDPRAPAFRALSGAYVPLTLQRRLIDIAETGHYAMPAMPLDSD